MAGERLAVVLALSFAACIATAGLGLADGAQTKPIRIEPARVHHLIRIVQFDTDESKRQAAIVELSRADPRLNSEVIQCVTDALLKDPSPSVRVAAVEAIVKFNAVFPLSGLALESAIEADASPIVQKAARQALWQYHLNGYKSVKGRDISAPQTAEPPIAKAPRGPIPAVAEPPLVTAVGQVTVPIVSQLPPVGPPPGPRLASVPKFSGPLALLAAATPSPSLSIEPPLARAKVTVAPIQHFDEPPIHRHLPEPSSVGTPPPFALDLPSIVPPPGPIPGVEPPANSTAEPPIARAIAKP